VIGEADKLFEKKDYDAAQSRYTEAARIDDSKTYPQERIEEITVILAQRQELEDNYNRAIATGDMLFNNQEYETALSEYQKANTFKPDEKYPIDQIDAINAVFTEKQSVDERFESYITTADQYFNSGDYDRAVKEYEKAAEIKPTESYPTAQLAAIVKLQADIQQTETQYEQLITDAERFFKEGNYEASKSKYLAALALVPDNSEPSEKITEIDQIIKDLEIQQEQYDAAIVAADAYYDAKNYEEAKTKYEEAARIKPGEQHPNTRIGEIGVLITTIKSNDDKYADAIDAGDRLLTKQSYAEAKSEFEKASNIKPNESYPKERINEINDVLAEIDAKQKAYLEVIAVADGLFTDAKYDLAKIEYQKAHETKPDENYPSDRIMEVDKILGNIELSQKQYAEIIASADLLFTEGKYEKAIAEYEKASALSPDEQYPKEKITEINTLVAGQAAIDQQYNTAINDADDHYKQKLYDQALTRYRDAAELKPEEKHPQDRIIEITALLAALTKENEGYDQAIKEGDNLFAMQQYDEAKLSYMKAANIKPKEEYPKNKIEEIEQLVATHQATIAEYNRMVAAADRMMESKEYDKAKAKYNEALTVLPDEQYPKNQLIQIENIFLATELALQENYNNAINEADALFESENYDQAKIKYLAAQKIKPGEEYPIQKIAEIDRLVSDFETLKSSYNVLIADADRHFKAKEYEDAKIKYVEASALFPDEEYPINKIEEINLVFKAELQRIQQAYDKAIADADKFLAASVFDQALESYRKAKSIKTDEVYPDEMINKIMVILDKNAVRDLVKSPVNINDREIKKLPFSPVSVSDRKSNFIVIKARNTSGNEFKVVMSYGKGASKNGGFVLPIPAGEQTKEYIISIGKQYTWFSEDNDYISLVPEGGVVEVSLLKISRSD